MTTTTQRAHLSASNINFDSISNIPARPLTVLKPPARYPSNLTPLPSELRPLCAAKDRLAQWLPHPDVLSEHATGPIPTDLQERIKAIALLGWADSTKAVYGVGLLVYHVFCDKKTISDKDRAPASSNLISAFISCLAGAYSGSAIHNYFYGVRAWHTLYGLPWAVNENQIGIILKGAAKLAPPMAKQVLRAPITTDMMEIIKAHLRDQNPFDTAFFACLTTVFYAAARVGEFTLRRLDSFNPNEHITRNNVRDDIDARNGLHTKVFFLPRTKSNLNGEEVNWAKQNGPTDPLAAFAAHLTINDPPSDGPLFAYKDGTKHKPLTRHSFVKHLKATAKAAGIESIQGHSIRIGATLEYLLRGMPFEVMKVKGRWASDAFQIYLRKHNQILAPYIQAMPPLTATEFTRIAMPPVR